MCGHRGRHAPRRLARQPQRQHRDLLQTIPGRGDHLGNRQASDDECSWSERPAVAAGGSTIHVVWYDGRLGPPRIFYKQSLDNGTTWGPDVCLTPTAGVGYHPSVSGMWFDLHVTWTDMSAGPQIYYTRSLDNGATWEAARNITPAAPAAGKNLASIAVADSIVHVTWMDTRRRAADLLHALARSWRDLETDRSITSVPSQFASVAVSGPSSTSCMRISALRATPRIYYTRSLDNGVNWETGGAARRILLHGIRQWRPLVPCPCGLAGQPQRRHRRDLLPGFLDDGTIGVRR